jgi:tetratricopeptide (TPR) repeat protein
VHFFLGAQEDTPESTLNLENNCAVNVTTFQPPVSAHHGTSLGVPLETPLSGIVARYSLCYPLALSNMTYRSAITPLFLLLIAISGCNKSTDQSAPPPAAIAATNSSVALPADTNSLPPEIEIDVDKSAEHLTRGNALLNEGKLREAISQFQVAIRFNPDDEDLYYNLAFAQTRVGETEAAKRSYQKALEIYPDYVEAHNNLGNILVAEGKFDEAIEHFQKALAQDDKNASTHNNLGTAYARQNKIARSLAHFETAVQLRPDYPDAQFNLGNAYLFLRRIDDAIDQYNKLLQLHPDFHRAREQLQRAKAANASASQRTSKNP